MDRNWIDQLKVRIGQGQIKNVLSELVDHFNGEHADLHMEAILLLSRFNRNQKDYNLGIVSNGENEIVVNRIVAAAGELLRKAGDEGVVVQLPEPEGTPAPGGGDMQQPIGTQTSTQPKVKKILFISANSIEAPLNTNQEVRKLKKLIKNYRDKYKIEHSMATTPDDLLDELQEHNPEIIHFSGHGEVDGIYLMDEDGDQQLVSKEDLEEVFEFFSKRQPIHFLFMNACYSADQSQGISKYVDHMVGSKGKLPDETAIKFSARFYESILKGESVHEAFKMARMSLKLNKALSRDLLTLIK